MKQEEVVKLASKCKKYTSECIPPSPLEVDVKKVMQLVSQKKFEEAQEILLESCPFPSITGRLIAPKNAKARDVLLVETFLGDLENNSKKQKPDKKAKKVAVVGGGPTGMTAAYYLAKHGYDVTLYEAMEQLGGFLRYKIPEFRLPRDALNKEENRLKALVKIKFNMVIGSGYSLKQLAKEFDAVGIATGANKPCFICIPGEHLPGVFTSSEFLYEPPAKGAQNTLIVGGGNSAVDCARAAVRLGNNVTIVYRRGVEDMLATKENIKAAQEEGIKFLTLTQPIEILGEEKVTAVKCQQMKPSYTDDDGRKLFAPIEESEFEILCDKVICALGHEPNPMLGRYLRTIGKGRPWVDEHRQTSMEGVFAAGMILNTKLKFEENLYEGLELAHKMDLYVKGKLGEEDGKSE